MTPASTPVPHRPLDRTRRRRGLQGALLAFALLSAAACHREAPRALGTLEYDRITVPAPVAERIVAIQVREGDRVRAGQLLIRLEAARTQSATQAAQAEVERQQAVVSELAAGPRTETIARARAQLAAAQAQARDAEAFYARLQPLGRRQLVAAADVDRARAAAGDAREQAKAAAAALAELEHGTRSEELAQGEAALRAARAQAAAQAVALGKLDVVAPRAAVVDSLPYRLGDQAPVGAPLAVLLVGDAPHARVYIPEPQRARIHVGDRLRVHVDGRSFGGAVRAIRSEPGFTPYYALAGDDAARLSYLAEVQLDAAAARLPAGLPLYADLPP